MAEGAVDDGEDADGQCREEGIVERRRVPVHQRLRCEQYTRKLEEEFGWGVGVPLMTSEEQLWWN